MPDIEPTPKVVEDTTIEPEVVEEEHKPIVIVESVPNADDPVDPAGTIVGSTLKQRMQSLEDKGFPINLDSVLLRTFLDVVVPEGQKAKFKTELRSRLNKIITRLEQTASRTTPVGEPLEEAQNNAGI